MHNTFCSRVTGWILSVACLLDHPFLYVKFLQRNKAHKRAYCRFIGCMHAFYVLSFRSKSLKQRSVLSPECRGLGAEPRTNSESHCTAFPFMGLNFTETNSSRKEQYTEMIGNFYYHPGSTRAYFVPECSSERVMELLESIWKWTLHMHIYIYYIHVCVYVYMYTYFNIST